MALELLAVAQELLAVPRVVRRSTGRNGQGVATVAAGPQALVGSCHGPEGAKAARRSARGVVHGFLVLVHGRGVSLSLLVLTLDLHVLQVCLLGPRAKCACREQHGLLDEERGAHDRVGGRRYAVGAHHAAQQHHGGAPCVNLRPTFRGGRNKGVAIGGRPHTSLTSQWGRSAWPDVDAAAPTAAAGVRLRLPPAGTALLRRDVLGGARHRPRHRGPRRLAR